MKILALVTARGGSKRLPGKNVRLLGGKPLIVWSIDVAKTSKHVCDILVSTDDSLIASISRKAGAYVPWLRPHELASDSAKSIDVALHALDWYESHHGIVDGLMLLQPTSPFRTQKTVRDGIKLFQDQNRSVIAVSEVGVHPSRCFNIDSGEIRMCYKSDFKDNTPVYAVNGSFYLNTPAALRQTKSFIEESSIPIIILNLREALDIDTELDWLMAESLLKHKALE